MPQAASAGAPAPPTLDLQQAVQDALLDLLSVAGLQHEDSWETGTLPPPAPGAGSAAPASARGEAQAPVATGRGSAFFSAPKEPATTAAAAAALVDEEAVQEQDLPPAAAVRLYQARLRAAQGDLAGMQAAVKARDERLSALEKEVQQLRWVIGRAAVGEAP